MASISGNSGKEIPNVDSSISVYIPNKDSRIVDFKRHEDTVESFIEKAVLSIKPGEFPKSLHYALRLNNFLTNEAIWMPRQTLMDQFLAHIANPSCPNADCPKLEDRSQNPEKRLGNSVWRTELRVRYIPSDICDLFKNDQVTCFYYFDQVRQDYIQSNPTNIDLDLAIQLCCLSIRHYIRNITKKVVEKKHHIDYIDKEVGFNVFLPQSVIISTKPKNLKKLIQSGYKKIYNFNDFEIITKFFDLIQIVFITDREKFQVTLSCSWNISGILYVGPNIGISYQTHPQADLIKVATFKDIKKITTSSICKDNSVNKHVSLGDLSNSSDAGIINCNCRDIKTQIRITTFSSEEDLIITCNGVNTAESIADLIDGYWRLLNKSNETIWAVSDSTINPNNTGNNDKSKTKQENQDLISKTSADAQASNKPVLTEDYAEIGLIEDEGDYSTPTVRNYELDRSQIVLLETIGVGQFGDVHVGVYYVKPTATSQQKSMVSNPVTDDNKLIPMHVAVKTCKTNDDPVKTEKFLEEAYIMQKFDHPHIIKLIGICSGPPIWIVMELARLGELRAYLKTNSGK